MTTDPHKRPALLSVQVERIPDIEPSSKEWVAWCDARDFHPLASSRRAWIARLNTYLRSADYLVYSDGGLIDAVMESEIIFGEGEKGDTEK